MVGTHPNKTKTALTMRRRRRVGEWGGGGGGEKARKHRHGLSSISDKQTEVDFCLTRRNHSDLDFTAGTSQIKRVI